MQTVRSHWPTCGDVTIDAYSSNPLVDDLLQAAPAMYQEAAALAPVPTLFPTGELPLFTASGIEPSLLLNLPAVVRHLAASADAVRAAEIFEKCGGGDEGAVWQANLMVNDRPVPGWNAYAARVEGWRWAIPPQVEYGIVFAQPSTGDVLKEPLTSDQIQTHLGNG